jgi:tRNA U55 pseudouridine synthase TruB
MSFLVRTAVGPHRLEEAFSLEEIAAAAERGRLSDLCLPASVALANLPELRLPPGSAQLFCQGGAPACDEPVTGLVRVCDAAGELLGIGEARDEGGRRTIQPRKVLASA